MTSSDVEIMDPRFGACVDEGARVEKLWEGCRWAEGPAYFAAGRYLVWSDIPTDRILRWDETTGAVGVFRHPAGDTNGHTVDRQGRLFSCERATRRVSRTEHDGSITMIADRYHGKRLNGPNDVVVRSDGSIWFTDPAPGIAPEHEGHMSVRERGDRRVYRVDLDSGKVSIAADDFAMPNGIAFSPDERTLYVSDTGASQVYDGPRYIRVFGVTDEGRLSDGGVFATCSAGFIDGFRLDDAGRIWTSAGDGVHCYDPDGTLLGKVRVPEVVANVAWGGVERNRLFICATTSLYSVLLPVNGAKTY